VEEASEFTVKKKTVAQILTLALIAAIVGFFIYKQRPPAAPAEQNGPESAVWRMVDASRAADAEKYLSCYTGEMEGLLRKNFQEMGAERFREYLSGTHRQIKGIAVSPPQMTSAAEARISVEYVYQDRNEVQQVLVRQVGRQWKIFQVLSAERIKTLVPYGTPVTE
jgi:hypothetical protein